MKRNYIKYILFLSFINLIQNNKTNDSIQINNIITDLNLIENNLNQEIEIKEIKSDEISSKVVEQKKEKIVTNQESKNNLNITIYDKNKILEIISNSSLSQPNNISIIDEKILNDDNMTKIETVENIIIQNTHEDQLAESIFYFLSFVLAIFIILFLYKFYKCFCENTIKEYVEEGTFKNPNNDPELQRISTHDEDNIIDMTES